jgi:hypothetical protein
VSDVRIFLVYDANELQELHLLEPVAEVRAGRVGGTYEGRQVESLPAYSSDDLQRVIDDLDALQTHVAPYIEPGASYVRSLQIASALLVTFPEEALRARGE